MNDDDDEQLARNIAGLDRYAEIKAKVIADFALGADDRRASMIAGLVLAQERLVEDMAAGVRVDYLALSRISEMLEKHLPPIVPKVQLEILDAAGAPYVDIRPGEKAKDAFIRAAKARHAKEGQANAKDTDPNPDPAAAEARPVAAEAPEANGSPAASQTAVPPISAPIEPDEKPISETMRAWNAKQGYARSSRDNGQIKGAPGEDSGSQVFYTSAGRSMALSCWHEGDPVNLHPYRNRKAYDGGG